MKIHTRPNFYVILLRFAPLVLIFVIFQLSKWRIFCQSKTCPYTQSSITSEQSGYIRINRVYLSGVPLLCGCCGDGIYSIVLFLIQSHRKVLMKLVYRTKKIESAEDRNLKYENPLSASQVTIDTIYLEIKDCSDRSCTSLASLR